MKRTGRPPLERRQTSTEAVVADDSDFASGEITPQPAK